jgi:hypothetical protein
MEGDCGFSGARDGEMERWRDGRESFKERLWGPAKRKEKSEKRKERGAERGGEEFEAGWR